MTQNRNSPFASVALPDEQMQVRVVWLYYMEGRTQGEIAE
ncbi:sugar-binding transcriptional regulator, partial [Rhizobium johnstonii]